MVGCLQEVVGCEYVYPVNVFDTLGLWVCKRRGVFDSCGVLICLRVNVFDRGLRPRKNPEQPYWLGCRGRFVSSAASKAPAGRLGKYALASCLCRRDVELGAGRWARVDWLSPKGREFDRRFANRRRMVSVFDSVTICSFCFAPVW